jgi:plasmid stabilization system protein ParE
MAIRFLPDAVSDLRALQTHLLRHPNESVWIEAETDLFEKLTHGDDGRLIGAVVPELISIGILDYRQVTTPHHRLLY